MSLKTCFSDQNIGKLYKQYKIVCTKDSYPLLRRLTKNYINYYLKNASMMCKYQKQGSIDRGMINLLQKMNKGTNEYHHSYYVERLKNSYNMIKNQNKGKEQNKDKEQAGGVMWVDGQYVNSTPKVETINQAMLERQFEHPTQLLEQMTGGYKPLELKGGKQICPSKGFDKYCQSVLSKFSTSPIKLSKCGIAELHQITEQFISKLGLNAVALSAEIGNKDPHRMNRDLLVQALP